MARLDDLIPDLNEDHPFNKEDSLIVGRKRRAWLVDGLDGNKSPIDEKGVINTIDTSGKGSVFPEEKSFLNKESINKVCNNLCFADLRSNPLQIFRFLYELAKNEDDDYKTPRVKLRDMMFHINITKDSARTALRFLLKQKFIQRVEFQPGLLGWSRYQLNKKICCELEKEMSKGSIYPFNINKVKNDSSSTFDTIDLWDEIDTSPLDSIGFNKKHLLQVKNKSSTDIVQESINHFAYSLQYNKKTKEYPNPLATLMAVLKRGEAWIEPNYQSPQELAQLKILESKKAELERKKALEDEFYKLAFDEWFNSLNEDEIKDLAPDNRKKGDFVPPVSKLNVYFKDNIWPEKRKDYLL